MSKSTAITPRPNAKGEHRTRAKPSSEAGTKGIRIPLAMTFEELLGGDGVLDETADEMIQAVRQWRASPWDCTSRVM